MSRMCKSVIIAFSFLAFITFLAWSVSDPGESSKELFSIEIDDEHNHVITSKNRDGVNPQDWYRQKADKDVYHKMNKVPVDKQQELNSTQLERESNAAVVQRPETFFSSLNLTFADIKLLENNSVPTEIFIAACKEMGPFLSKLGSGISVLKKEIESNLNDIERKFVEDKESYHTLQAMILSEIDSGVVMKHHTCSRSLRWIRRMFEFIYIFLENLATGQKDVTKAARTAYDKTISVHHNFFIRKAISTGMHMLPSYNTFLISMSVDRADADKPNFEQVFNQDVLHYISTLKPICNNIRQFYTDHNLGN